MHMRSSARRENLTVALLFLTSGVVFLGRMAVLYLTPYIAPELRLSGAQVGSLAGVMARCRHCGRDALICNGRQHCPAASGHRETSTLPRRTPEGRPSEENLY